MPALVFNYPKSYIPGGLCLLLLPAFRLPSADVALTGHLRSATHMPVGGLVVFARGNIFNAQAATTDARGDFQLHFDTPVADTTPVSFYYVTTHNDTVLLRRVRSLGSDAPEITFFIP